MNVQKFGTLFIPIFVGAVVFVPGAASATNGAQFTSLSAEYVELDTYADDIYSNDNDGHADDLVVRFSETGIGNSKVSDITVTATREVAVTCVSADRAVSVITSDPLS